MFFEWKTGTASSAMYKALKERGITMYYKFFTPCISLNGEEVYLDYKHIKNDIYEIVQKVYNYKAEPIYKSIEL